MSPRVTASLLIAAAVLANVAFAALGSIFDYPDVLDEPAAGVLASFRAHEGAVSAWFTVLALSAALLAPIAIGVRRLSSHPAMRIALWVGVAAAVVQVIGLLRWPILVPGYAADGDTGAFTTASDILGTAIGETLGYALTAAWTVLVVVALGRRFAGRWFAILGVTAAALVAAGVVSPLDLPVVDEANFIGYVLYSVWLIAFGVVLLVRERSAPRRGAGAGDREGALTAMAFSTDGLARACAVHPRRTVAVWGAVVLASFAVIAVLLGSALTTGADVTAGTESKQAAALIRASFPPQPAPSELVVVRSDRRTADEPQFRAQVRSLAARAAALGAVAGTPSVSADRHAALVPLVLNGAEIAPLVQLVAAANGRDGFQVAITGSETADADFEQLSGEDLQKGELLIGLPVALIVLLLVFGAVVAGLVPVLLGVLSIVVAVALTALVGQAFEVSFFVVNMISAMGLALGIDYALFILSRYREERGRGLEQVDAIVASGATASRAVLFSGIAFVLAMLGMLLVPDTVLRSLALGAILVGIVSVLAALTLLPAVLSLLGDRVNAGRIPVVGRRAIASAGSEGRFWSALVRGVMRRPLVSLVAASALLLGLALPVLQIETGFSGLSTLPDRFPSKQGFDALSRDFPGASVDPARIVIQGAASPAAIGRLEASLARDKAFGPATRRVSSSGDVTVLSVPVTGDADGHEAVSAIRTLRAELIPQALGGTGATVLVGGATAENADYFDIVGGWLPLVLAFVLGLSFILLTVAFRSIVIPAVAIVLNLLAVGAAYGLLVLVFQQGAGNELLGFQQVDTVEAWVPLFLFSVLFGLSMDYQVFLLSRIKERYAQTGDTAGAVAFGVGSTARLITGAALIIIAVFGGFAAGDLVMFQQMGFGVAVALLIDATIVRCVLVPASMKLLGERNWYLPSWLGWMPDVHVEGHSAEQGADSLRPVASQAGG